MTRRVSGMLDLAVAFHLSAGDDLMPQSRGVSCRGKRYGNATKQAATAAVEKQDLEVVAPVAAQALPAEVDAPPDDAGVSHLELVAP